MEAKNIVAIEIASSKVKGAVAAVAPDGTLTILAVDQIPCVNMVRHGRVQNVREVSATVNSLISKLENSPLVAPAKIRAVVLALGGRSLAATPASASITFSRELEVSEETIRRLKKEAAKDFVSTKNIEETIARKFFVNNVEVKSAVGTVGSSLKGDFLIVSCARENRQNLERLKFDTINAGSVFYQLRPTALADLVLSPDDRQLGCALVDFGAETVTVSVYKDGTLGFLSTLPMGSRLITMDLMSGLKLTESAAEDFKLRLGSLGDYDATAPNADDVNDYVRARAGEIAANIVNQIELSGFAPENLGAGIVLAGGGAMLPEFGTLLAGQSHMPLRHARMPEIISFVDDRLAVPANIDVVAIAAAAAANPEIDCLSRREPEADVAAPTAPIVAAVEEPIHAEPEPERPSRRYVPAEDDPDLLADDDDDAPRRPRGDAPQKPKLAEPKPVEDEEDEEDEEEAPEQSAGRLQSLLNKLTMKIDSIFGAPTDEDEEDDVPAKK